MTSKEISTKRFINRIGFPVHVSAKFQLLEDADIGDQDLKVEETLGLMTGAILSLESSGSVTVDSTAAGLIHLKAPLEEALKSGSLLTVDSDSKAIFASPGKDITRDSIEMNRRIRLPADLSLTYSSILVYGVSSYFVTSYQRGDSSLSIGLKLINDKIDWYAQDPSFKSQTGVDDGNAVDWGDSDPTSWPPSPGLVPVKTNIPAYQEQLSLYSNLKEPGYIPSLSRTYIIPKWIPIKAGDYLKANGDMLRVVGIDYTRIRNMQALSVDFGRGVDTDAKS